MEKSLLSVVITTYEREFSVIEESLKSILNQTYKNIEILVVDDNHPDSPYSAELVEGLKKYPEIKYIKLKKNSGACYARNVGILAAKGEFVGFLDDDDLWIAEKAEKQVKEFESENVGLVFCRGLNFNDEDITQTKPYYTDGNFVKNPTFNEMLRFDLIGSTSQAVIRRESFAKFGMFDPELPARQDYDMWLRVIKSGMIAVGVDEPLFMHRMHVGEQISKNPKKALKARLYLKQKYKEDYKKNKRAYFILLTTISGHYLACGDKLNGLVYALRAFFKEPVHFFKFLSTRKSRSNEGFKFD